MPARYILAVDLGTSGAKVALIGVDGRVAAWESEPVTLRVLPGGGAEQAPDDWWRALVAAARRLLARHAGPASEIAAVCCSTQGEGTVPVDGEGRALMDCVLWMDMRGAPHLRRQFGGLANMQGMSLPRIRRWIRLTGGMPSPTGKDPAAHMLLVRDAFPEVYERTYKFLNVLDYLNLRLTGRFVATFDSILTSWVTDNRDADDIRYDPGLVKRLRHRRRQAARDREVHRGARAARRLRRPRRSGWRRGRRSSPAPSTTPPPPSAPARWRTTRRTCTSARRRGCARTCRSRRPTSSTSLASVPVCRPRSLAPDRPAGHGRRQPHLSARQHPVPRGRAAGRSEAARRLQDLRPHRGARAAGQQRRALHAVDLGGARAGRRPHLARRPLQPLAREHARGHRARLPRGRRLQHALADGAGAEVPRPARRRPSTWWAAAAARPCGARSSPTCSASRCGRSRTRSRRTPAARP